VIARRKCHIARNPLLRLADESALVSPTNRTLHRDATLVRLTRYPGGTLRSGDRSQRRKRNDVTIRRSYVEMFYGLPAAPRVCCFPDSHVEDAITIVELSHGAPTDAGFHRINHVADSNSLTTDRISIQRNTQLRLSELLLDSDIDGAWHAADNPINLVSLFLKHVQIGTKNLYYQLASHS
jgi:hypothetical protein